MGLPRVRPARVTILTLMLVFLLAVMPRAFALSNGQPASLVIGEPSLTKLGGGASSTGIVGPHALTFDSSGDLWVADSYGNRILEYKAPFTTAEAASLVIGQPSFTSIAPAATSTGLNTPNGLAFDSSGDLWVSDSSNNRVLEYKAPLSTAEAASLVIGQSNFTSGALVAASATSLDSPYGLALDSSGNLWVADLQNGRILEYASPFSTHEAATLVIGEPNLTATNDEVSKAGLNAPNAVTFDSSGNLWVVDGHRVLEYTKPFATHEAASLVIGQNTFTNSSTVTTSTGMDMPAGIAFDSSGNLWIADSGNDRVLRYGAPLSTFEAASLVMGQSNFTSAATTPETQPTAAGLNDPTGVAVDSSGNLWVADFGDGRVVQFAGATPTPEFPTFAVPIVFIGVLAAALLVAAPRGRFQRSRV